MSKYKCNKCTKIFTHKNDYRKHILRKTDCSIIEIGQGFRENEVVKFTCNKCSKQYSRKDSLKRHELCFCKGSTIIPPNVELVPPMITKNKKNYTCTYCLQNFSRSDSLVRHLNGRCKIKKEKESKDEIFNLLVKEMNDQRKLIESLKQELHNNINSNNKNCNNTITNTTNNTQHITNNNIIVAFGKEKLGDIVNDNICKKILFRGFEAVPQLIEYVHFNEKKPEYHNCYISNMQNKYAIVYDGNNWKLEDAIEVINTLRDDSRIFLENKFDEFYDSLDEETKKKFGRFLSEADSNIVIDRYKNDVRLLLYNKRGIVINTRNNPNLKNDINNALPQLY